MPDSTLSEAALLASDPNDYMKEAQLAFFRQRLLGMQEQLLQTGQRSRKGTPSNCAPGIGSASFSQRWRPHCGIEDGSDGECEETGEVIRLARLLARPTATLCIDAQERRKRLQKAFAG